MVGSESSYTISITSSVGVITFAINGVIGNSSLPNNMRLLVVNSTTFSLLWMPLDHYENFVLDVISHVLIGEIPTAYSLFRPQIHLCNCQNGGTCTTDGVLQYDDNFILLRCICSTGRIISTYIYIYTTVNPYMAASDNRFSAIPKVFWSIRLLYL